MEDSEIIYKTSTDYDRLRILLKEGKTLIGFCGLFFKGEINDEFSQLIPMNYNEKWGCYNIGASVFESDFPDEKFIELCKVNRIRFIEP